MSSRIEQLRAFLEQTPDDTFLNYALGLEYMSQGAHNEALEQFRLLLERYPEYSATYYQLGKLYEAMGRPEAAVETYEAGIKLTSRLGEHKNMGELRSALDELTFDF